MFERPHLQLFIKRIQEPRNFIQVLTGPRQVGKTTMVRQLLDKIHIPGMLLSADAVAAPGSIWLQEQWEAVRLNMQAKGLTEYLLVIDEIQKINNWSETVKQLWDADTQSGLNLKILLLGSSRLLLQAGLSESLAGRFETTYMGHWSFNEMQEAFGWTATQYIWFGGYPGSAPLIHDEPRWKQYISQSLIETSISKDILMMTRVDKPALMRRLFELGCQFSSQILSYNKMLGQLQDAGNTTTLSHYLHLLGTAGLLSGIDKYAVGNVQKRGSSPKLQVHNTALLSAQYAEHLEEIGTKRERWGRIVESAIGAHLLNHALTENFQLYYWRDRNQEVDFVIERKGVLIGIEVKSGIPRPGTGMAAFAQQFQHAKTILVGDNSLPCEVFLKINPTEML